LEAGRKWKNDEFHENEVSLSMLSYSILEGKTVSHEGWGVITGEVRNAASCWIRGLRAESCGDIQVLAKQPAWMLPRKEVWFPPVEVSWAESLMLEEEIGISAMRSRPAMNPDSRISARDQSSYCRLKNHASLSRAVRETGKTTIFQAAIAGGATPLVIVGVLSSAIAAFFYVRVIVLMFFNDPAADGPAVVFSPASTAAVAVGALATVVLGVVPGPALHLAQSAASQFFVR